MPVNLASPGIVVREVDLTVGRVDATSGAVGALVAPFAKGPVGVPVLVSDESDLLANFGEPYETDKHYEHWMVASSYLAYGGNLQVVRADDNLLNAVSAGSSEIKIKSKEHYNQLGYENNYNSNVFFAARNPGSWANGIKVAVIDAKADQTLTMSTTAVETTTFSADANPSDGDIGITTTSITGITTTNIEIGDTVKLLSGVIGSGTTVTGISTANGGTVTISPATLNTVSLDNVELSFGAYSTTTTLASPEVGYGVTQAISAILPGAGTTSILDGHLKGIITRVGSGEVDVKVLSHVSAAGTETNVDYQPSGVYKFSGTGTVAIHTNGHTVSYGTTAVTAEKDWYDQQNVTLTGSTVSWNALADRPGTSSYAEARNSRFDEVHVVVFDDKGTITGNAGTILEKHLALSKATDAEYSLGSTAYWRKYLYNTSTNLFGLGAPSSGLTTTSYSSGFNLDTTGTWDKVTDGIKFQAIGNTTYTMEGGTNYGSATDITESGALTADLDGLTDGYGLFENTDNYDVDFLIMGSGNYTKETAQAIANKLISVAEIRQDAIAFISPYRGAFLSDGTAGTVTVNSDSVITDNVIEFYSPVTSSTYAVFDSGYKYAYDRFTDSFRYVPLNGDIAGLCARNDLVNFPWFSPAGTARGAILNAVKLAYNPNKVQRDRLYSNRINPVIFSAGDGIVLFGDKTGFAKSSAFDRINVRRLFIYLEQAIAAAAKDQLFEFNDEITRTNFVNIVEPFLRDVQSKRGIFDYVVICDETNNTAAVIDNNEFVADIFIKPNRSINFIGLTFVATRTGVSFSEVVGNV
jgi:hypothetical protein